MSEEKKVGRPELPLSERKKLISIKLHPNLIVWLDRQKEKRPELIETALCEYYQIPEHIFTPVERKKKRKK